MSETRPRVPKWVWPVVVLAVVLVVAACIWGGMWYLLTSYDSRGKPVVDAPAAVVIAAMLTTITALAAPAVAVLVKRLGDIRHQVQNSHQANLRDDIDGKHDEVLEWLERIDGRIDRVDRRLDRAEKDIDNLEDANEKHHPKEKP